MSGELYLGHVPERGVEGGANIANGRDDGRVGARLAPLRPTEPRTETLEEDEPSEQCGPARFEARPTTKEKGKVGVPKKPASAGGGMRVSTSASAER